MTEVETDLILEKPHDPATAYRPSTTGMRAEKFYRGFILENAKPVPIGSRFKIRTRELEKLPAMDTVDTDIEAILPTEHCFDETEVSAVLSTLLPVYPLDKEAKDAYRPIVLYTKEFVVRVYLPGLWEIDAWFRNCGCMSSPRRVIYPVR